MSIKCGAHPIEFEKGRAGIVVQSKDKLSGAIYNLIVAAGELDELSNQEAKIGAIGKAKKVLERLRTDDTRSSSGFHY